MNLSPKRFAPRNEMMLPQTRWNDAHATEPCSVMDDRDKWADAKQR
jgi:hypothetical protein